MSDTEERDDPDEQDDSDEEVDLGERINQLVARASETVEMIASKEDEDELGPTLSLLDDLEDVADEAEDLLSTVDLTQLAGAIDWESLPEAVEVEDIPEAIEEGDASEAVSLRKLLVLTDLPELWASMDQRELWRQKRELDDEVDDLTDDDGGRDGDEATFDVSMPDAGNHDIDPESVENALQSKVSGSVGEFREKLLAAHDRLAEVRERNQERFPDRRRKRSRNPTAVSTMPKSDSIRTGGATYSTVPEETRHSSAPNRRRIYGPRFESADGGDDGE